MRALLVRGAVVLLVVSTVVGLDQASKLDASRFLRDTGVHVLVGNYLILVYAENEGGFLSLGSRWPAAARRLLFVVLSVAIVAALLLYVLSSQTLRLPSAVAFALLAGGGVSNLIDRIFHGGRVVDFLNLGVGSLRTGIFNLADVAVLAGMALLLLSEIKGRRRA